MFVISLFLSNQKHLFKKFTTFTENVSSNTSFFTTSSSLFTGQSINMTGRKSLHLSCCTLLLSSQFYALD